MMKTYVLTDTRGDLNTIIIVGHAIAEISQHTYIQPSITETYVKMNGVFQIAMVKNVISRTCAQY